MSNNIRINVRVFLRNKLKRFLSMCKFVPEFSIHLQAKKLDEKSAFLKEKAAPESNAVTSSNLTEKTTILAWKRNLSFEKRPRVNEKSQNVNIWRKLGQ